MIAAIALGGCVERGPEEVDPSDLAGRGGLGIVGLLIMGMVALDVRLGQRVEVDTGQIINNAQRSIVLIDSIRTRAVCYSACLLMDLAAA